VFVDCTQAYRNKIIECLVQHKVPAKLIRLIELTLTDPRARVKINNEYTGDSKTESGIQQADPVSATVFSIVTDAVLKQMDLRQNISTHLKQYSAYTDDRLITTIVNEEKLNTYDV
jgi:hypothetical protein